MHTPFIFLTPQTSHLTSLPLTLTPAIVICTHARALATGLASACSSSWGRLALARAAGKPDAYRVR